MSIKMFILVSLNKMMTKKIKYRPDSIDSAAGQNDRVRYLVLHNDEIHTIKYVISCLVEVCAHDPVQAEQCAYITHYKGKCEVKSGGHDDLEPMREALIDRGLQVTIE